MSRGPLPDAATRAVLYAEGTPQMPPWLDAVGSAEWARVVPILRGASLLTFADLTMLAAYCQAWSELVFCTETLEKNERFVEEPIQNSKGESLGTRLKAHPALAAQRDAFARLKAYAAEFGFSPASRARLAGGRGGDGGPSLEDALKGRS